MDKYEKLEKLGEGAHGVVVKARVRTADQVRQERRLQRRREEEEEKGIATILGQVRKQNRHAGSRADARDCRAVTAAAPRARVASESQLIAALCLSLLQGTPKKRKFEDEVEASAAAAAAADAEAEGQEPDDIHLPAPPDTSVHTRAWETAAVELHAEIIATAQHRHSFTRIDAAL